MRLLSTSTLAALLLSTTIAGSALAASTDCVKKTDGEGGTSFTSAGVKKTEGEGGTSFTSAGVKKTEGEGGTSFTSAGVKKTEGEATQAMATPCQ